MISQQERERRKSLDDEASNLLAAARGKQPVAAPGQQFLYVIGAKGQPLKIGIARNVRSRIGALQTSSPHRLRIYFKGLCPPGAAREIEAACHRRLRAYRMKGEWFGVLPPIAVEVVESVLKSVDPTAHITRAALN